MFSNKLNSPEVESNMSAKVNRGRDVLVTEVKPQDASSKVMALIEDRHSKRAELLERLVDVKHQYDLACMAASEATQRREVQLQHLHKIVEELTPLMNNLTDDPSYHT